MKARKKGLEIRIPNVSGYIKEHPILSCVTIFLILSSLWLKVEFAKDFRPPLPGQDDETYHRIGAQIAKGASFPGYYYAPGYSHFLGIVYFLFGDSYLTGRMAMIALSLVNSLIIFLIAKLLFNQRTAYIAFIISLFDLDFHFFATNLYTEILFIFFVLLMFYFSFALIEKKTLKLSIAAGASIALAMFIKFEIAIMIPLWIIWVFLNVKDKKAVYRFAAALLVTIFIIQLPWFVRNYNISGGEMVLVSTTGGVNMWIGNNPYATGSYDHSPPPGVEYNPFKSLDHTEPGYDAKKNNLATKLALQYIRENPAVFLKKSYTFLTEYWLIPTRKYLRRWHPDNYLIYAWALELFAIAGLLLSFRKNWMRHSLIYAFFLTTTFVYMISFYMQRYKVPLIPFAIIFAAYAIHEATTRVRIKGGYIVINKD